MNNNTFHSYMQYTSFCADTGKVMKVVFTGSSTFDPIVAEEITVSTKCTCYLRTSVLLNF